MIIFGFLVGLVIYVVFRLVLSGFYVVRPDQRAVLTSFGRAARVSKEAVDDPHLSDDEKERYVYPQVQVIRPGGPYYKFPWQKVHKVSVSTKAVDLTWDPTKEQGTIEAVTKDNLTTGTNGQLRYKVSENNLYAYLFGVQDPLQHVMGFFISVFRERIANFVDPKRQVPAMGDEDVTTATSVDLSEGVSINDLRKNLHVLNEFMEAQCRGTSGRYGIELEAALVTEIDPPAEVDRALSAINSTRNQVAADISTARADSEQQITMSNRAVEIATNNALAEVAPLNVLSDTLTKVKGEGGSTALKAYLRNMRVPLLGQARNIIQVSE